MYLKIGGYEIQLKDLIDILVEQGILIKEKGDEYTPYKDDYFIRANYNFDIPKKMGKHREIIR